MSERHDSTGTRRAAGLDGRWTAGASGRVAVITGGTRGLGLALAKNLGRDGALVVVGSRDPNGVERAVQALRDQGLRATGRPCDVTRLEDVRALAALAQETYGPPDLWVNNAGLSAPYGPTLSVPPEAFAQAVATNVLGTYHGSIVALQAMLPRGRGRLVNLLGRGDTRPAPNQNAYGASKAWVRMFTLALAREYRGRGVSIAALNPGLVRTDLLLRPTVVAGFEKAVLPLGMVVNLWGRDADDAARRAVAVITAETLRNGREWHALTPLGLGAGLLNEAWRRLTGRAVPPAALDIRSVPSAWEDRPPEPGTPAAPEPLPWA